MKNRIKGAARDTRWQTHIDAVSDMLAFTLNIKQELEFIQAQAEHANPREVATNLLQIRKEVKMALADIQKLRQALAALQETMVDDIYRDAEGQPTFRLASDGFTYVAREGDQGAGARRRKEGSDDQDKG